jgi:hypothetical protein
VSDPNRFLPEIVGVAIGSIMVVLLVAYVIWQLSQR